LPTARSFPSLEAHQSFLVLLCLFLSPFLSAQSISKHTNCKQQSEGNIVPATKKHALGHIGRSWKERGRSIPLRHIACVIKSNTKKQEVFLKLLSSGVMRNLLGLSLHIQMLFRGTPASSASVS